MAISEFPVTKLLGLLIRQVSSPVARRIKEYAKNHEFFKKNVCMAAGQLYHWWELRAKLWILKLGRPISIPVLNERDAINLGGDILGEAVVFFICSSVLIAELGRQGMKEERKKQAQQAEMDAALQALLDLKTVLQERAERIAQLAESLKEHEVNVEEAKIFSEAQEPEPEGLFRKILMKMKELSVYRRK